MSKAGKTPRIGCLSALRVLIAAAVFAAISSAVAKAHPHQFIDISAELLLDDAGRLEAIRTHWTVEESFTLSLAAGIGVNPDGPLTPSEEEKIDPEFSVNFATDNWLTHVSQEGRPLTLLAPRNKRYRLSNGVLSFTWELPLAQPPSLDKAPMELQFYDPSFLALATLKGRPTLRGSKAERCSLSVEKFVPDAAAKKELALLLLLPVDATPEDPRVGRKFADRIEVRCGNGASAG